MKGNRLLASLILGLGLTLALCLTLSARQDARAAPPPTGVRRELALFPLERQDPELTIPSAASYWRDVPVTTLPIENPDDIPESAWDKIHAQLRRDSDDRAAYPLTIDHLLTSQAAKLTATDGAASDIFGWSVAASGDTVVVGALQNDDACPADPDCDSGSAYIFARNEGGIDNWGQAAKLTAIDGAAEDNFGSAVAVSGDTVVVGAYQDDDNGNSSGSAYVFTRNAGGIDNWGQTAKITATDGVTNNQFGYAVATSGDTIVIGAHQDGDNGYFSGSAYIFTRNEGGMDNWGQTTKITAADGMAWDYFGSAVAVSGDTVLVGAYGDGDSDNGFNSGSVYLFTRNAGGMDNWGQTVKITATDSAAEDYFGSAVAVSGDTIVVGAYGNDDGGEDSGSAYVFSRNEGGMDNWGQTVKITATDGAAFGFFGSAVAVSGDTVIVGAYQDSDNGSNSGSAYVFTRNAGGIDNWGQTTKITATDGVVSDSFGFAVAVSGNTVVVGAIYDDDACPAAPCDSGSAYLFSRTGNSWPQQSKPTATNGAATDHFGYAVAVNGDTVVVGAHQDDDDGDNSGSAYVFSRNAGGMDNWGQTTKITATNGAAEDHFGYAVAVSGDTIVVGAYQDDDDGSAYVFTRNAGGLDNWGHVAKIHATDGAMSDKFGFAVAVSGDTIVVGAYQDGDHGYFSGSAYVFSRNAGGADNWGQTTKISADDGAMWDYFGYAVAVDRDTVVVGAYGDDDVCSANPCESGSAYVFGRNAGGMNNWSQTVKITTADGAATDYFGYAVAVSGDTIVVGAYGDDDNGAWSGSAYIFNRNTGGMDNWGQMVKITADDGAPSDFFGAAVAASGDTVVVGAHNDDDDGSSSGSAYVFARNTGGMDNWGQTTKITAGDGAEKDYFGRAVAVSGDTIAVGAYQDDDGGDNSGSTYVYRWEYLMPEITVVPDSLVFGNQYVDAGATLSQTVTITNDGDADLHISAVTQVGDTSEFNLADSGKATLSPGSTRTITVSFDPSSVGPKTITLTIQSDDDDEPALDVTLGGTGNVNGLPVTSAGDNRRVPKGGVVTLDGSSSNDPDGHLPLTYSWDQIGGPGVTFTPNLSITTFTAPTSTTVLTFTLTVTDALGLPGTPDTVVITVTASTYLPLVLANY